MCTCVKMGDRRRFVSNHYYRLPPIGETVPVDLSRRYQDDGYPGYGQDWTVPDLHRMHNSNTKNKRQYSPPKFAPDLMSDPGYLGNRLRAMEMLGPREIRAPLVQMSRPEDVPGRFSSYPAPRFSHIPKAFLSQSFQNDDRQYVDDPNRRSSETSASNTARPATPRPYRERARDRSLPYRFYRVNTENGYSPTSRLPPLPAINRSLDRLVQGNGNLWYSRNMTRARFKAPQVKDPLSCKCCAEMNKINLRNQRLGRSTRYPLQASVPQIEQTILVRRLEKTRHKEPDCKFPDLKESEEEELNKQF